MGTSADCEGGRSFFHLYQEGGPYVRIDFTITTEPEEGQAYRDSLGGIINVFERYMKHQLTDTRAARDEDFHTRLLNVGLSEATSQLEQRILEWRALV